MIFIGKDVELHFIVDATYVSNLGAELVVAVKHLKAGEVLARSCLYGGNADLWSVFVETVALRAAPTTFSWSKSHGSAEQLYRGHVCR